MKPLPVATFAAWLFLSLPLSAFSWTAALLESEVTAVTGMSDASLGAIAVNPGGHYGVVDTFGLSAPIHKILMVNPSATPKVRLIVNQLALRNAVDAVNGTSPPPTMVSIAGLAFAPDGTLLAVSGNHHSGSDQGTLFAVNTTTGALRVISSNSVLIGARSITVIGNYAFITRGRDSVLRVDATSSASDGSVVPVTAISSAQLESATGDSGLWIMINTSVARGNTLILVNSGANYSSTEVTNSYGSNDNVIQASVDENGAVSGFSTIVTGNELDTALSTPDVGLPAIAALPAAAIWLFNNAAHATTVRGFIKVKGVTPSPAITFETGTTVAASLGNSSDLIIVPANGMVYHSGTNTIAATLTNHPSVALITQNLATSVADWTLLE